MENMEKIDMSCPSGWAFHTKCWLARPSCAESIPALKEITSNQFAAYPIINKNSNID